MLVLVIKIKNKNLYDTYKIVFAHVTSDYELV